MATIRRLQGSGPGSRPASGPRVPTTHRPGGFLSRPTAAHVAAIRRFSRFYTGRIGVLQEGLLASPFSLAEARLLYELAQRDTTTASGLAGELRLDPGYVSRILRGFRRRGLVEANRSRDDRRRIDLSLTAAGREAFTALDAASSDDAAAMLEPLAPEDRERLVDAMETVAGILGPRPEPRAPWILRPPRPGDLGWVVHRHGVLYGREYGWDERFEALVAGIVAAYVKDHDPRTDRCWIAEKDGENVGSVFLVRKSKTVGQLRLLLVEPSARGLGIGRRLVRECVRHARQVGFRKIVLWTNDVLHAARRIYQAEGFVLVAEEPHDDFGEGLVGQFWELAP